MPKYLAVFVEEVTYEVTFKSDKELSEEGDAWFNAMDNDKPEWFKTVASVDNRDLLVLKKLS